MPILLQPNPQNDSPLLSIPVEVVDQIWETAIVGCGQNDSISDLLLPCKRVHNIALPHFHRHLYSQVSLRKARQLCSFAYSLVNDSTLPGLVTQLALYADANTWEEKESVLHILRVCRPRELTLEVEPWKELLTLVHSNQGAVTRFSGRAEYACDRIVDSSLAVNEETLVVRSFFPSATHVHLILPFNYSCTTLSSRLHLHHLVVLTHLRLQFDDLDDDDDWMIEDIFEDVSAFNKFVHRIPNLCVLILEYNEGYYAPHSVPLIFAEPTLDPRIVAVYNWADEEEDLVGSVTVQPRWLVIPKGTTADWVWRQAEEIVRVQKGLRGH